MGDMLYPAMELGMDCCLMWGPWACCCCVAGCWRKSEIPGSSGGRWPSTGRGGETARNLAASWRPGEETPGPPDCAGSG